MKYSMMCTLFMILICGVVIIYILAIFTLSSGLSTCGSSDTKKMEKIAAYDLQKKHEFCLFAFLLKIAPRHTRRSVVSKFETWICWRIESNMC